jgi:hypothetical protein
MGRKPAPKSSTDDNIPAGPAPGTADKQEKTMIVEMRTYQIQAGRAGEFLKVYQDNGLAIITQYARLLGCWTSESGVLNSVVFLWAYDDFGHRTAQRAKLAQDNRWQAFVPSILPYLVHQESVFLNPVAFSPIR